MRHLSLAALLLLSLGGPASAVPSPKAPGKSATATRARAKATPSLVQAPRIRGGLRFTVPHGVDKPGAVVSDRANPLHHLPPGKPGRLVLGVMGGAGAISPDEVNMACEKLGEAIGKAGHVTLTGAAPGLPDRAVRGARRVGGLTIGISPFANMADHIAAGSPTNLDILQLTELLPAQKGQRRPNFFGREINNIEFSDAIIIIGGRFGTLTELGLALDEQRPVGILTGTGGITKVVKAVIKASSEAGKPPGAPVIYDSNPDRLVTRLTQATIAWKAKGIVGPLGDHAPIIK